MRRCVRIVAISLSCSLILVCTILWIIRPRHLLHLNTGSRRSYFALTTPTGLTLGAYPQLFIKPRGFAINPPNNNDIFAYWPPRKVIYRDISDRDFVWLNMGVRQTVTAGSPHGGKMIAIDILLPYWLGIVLGLLMPAPLILRRQRGNAGHCANCGYDLRGTPRRCPECGTAAEVGTDASAISVYRGL